MTAPGGLVAEVHVPAPPRRRGLVIGAAMVVLLVLTAIVSFRWGSAGSREPLPTVSLEPTAVEKLTTSEIYAALAPSVVTIEAESPGRDTGDTIGTGVIANARGIIVTALHVVKDTRSTPWNSTCLTSGWS